MNADKSGCVTVLKRLQIENLAIVEGAEIEFAPGLNAITGETGAGKSVLIGALELALGGRAKADSVRTGAGVGVVEAEFAPPFPRGLARVIRDELGLEWSEKEALVLRREVSAQGRSRAFIAGQLVNVSDLNRVSELLVDLHGQHEHQSLLHRAAQRAAVDAFGGHEPLLGRYGEAYERFVALRRRQEQLEAEARDFEKRLDFLAFQIKELEELNPAAGETAQLESEEARLNNAEALAQAAGRGYALLYEGEGEEAPSVLAALREVERALAQIAQVDATMQPLGDKCGEVRALVEDLAFALRDYAGRCEADPARLEEVAARLAALQRMQRKHGTEDEAELVRVFEGLRAERDRMMLDDRERSEIAGKRDEAEQAVTTAAESLSRARTAAAAKLAKAAIKTLERVGMEKAKFAIDIQASGDFTAEGRDAVEFVLAANVGEGSRPLREVASGGELSRTMLALKTALAERDAIPTLVFDEIDAGLSGETAARVGTLMEELGRSHQLVCITHHASIAARAGRHLAVRKETSAGRTRMSAAALTKDERLEELAKMMGGEGAGPAGRKLARQLMSAGG